MFMFIILSAVLQRYNFHQLSSHIILGEIIWKQFPSTADKSTSYSFLAESPLCLYMIEIQESVLFFMRQSW